MSVLYNWDPQIIWLLEKIYNISHWKKISRMASKANKHRGFGEPIWVPVIDWYAHYGVLRNSFCLLHLLVLSYVMFGVDTHIHSFISRG